MLLPLLLAGCQSTPSTMMAHTTVYECDEGRRFTATYDEANDIMAIAAGTVIVGLSHAKSASGARYARGDMEYWSKGSEAMLNGFPGGPFDNCHEVKS